MNVFNSVCDFKVAPFFSLRELRKDSYLMVGRELYFSLYFVFSCICICTLQYQVAMSLVSIRIYLHVEGSMKNIKLYLCRITFLLLPS